jgi:hypothetical protein
MIKKSSNEKTEELIVRKASGKKEYFSFQKLRNSLLRSSASLDEAEGILNQLKSKIYEGISTKKIYSMAFRLLKNQSPHYASRYALKKGIMELGPSGFPFEKFIGEIFKYEGYRTEVGTILQGRCVTHEIDVICKKEDHIMLIECKYKNQESVAVDVKVPLYIHSRFQDLLENNLLAKPYTKFIGWIVTNSRFTDDALAYGNCRNIQLLGWDYPFKNSLKNRIDASCLYPITCLSTITINEKKWFLEKGIVLVSEICDNKRILQKAGISEKRIDTVLNECQKLTEFKIRK